MAALGFAKCCLVLRSWPLFLEMRAPAAEHSPGARVKHGTTVALGQGQGVPCHAIPGAASSNYCRCLIKFCTNSMISDSK